MEHLAISLGENTLDENSHGIKEITEHVTGVPKVLSFLIQHKGMTFHGVKDFSPS